MAEEASDFAPSPGPGSQVPPTVTSEPLSSPSSSAGDPPGAGEQGVPAQTTGATNGDPRMIELLERIGRNQERVLTFMQEQADPGYGVSESARHLWQSPCNAWTDSSQESEAPTDDSIGWLFLNRIVPCGTSLMEALYRTESSSEMQPGTLQNVLRAREALKKLLEDAWCESWLKEHFVNHGSAATLSNIDTWWPKTWELCLPNLDETCCSGNDFTLAYPASYQEPFAYRTTSGGKTIMELPRTGTSEDGQDKPVCGIISWFSVRRSMGVIDFKDIAALLCLGQGGDRDDIPVVLKRHAGSWQEFIARDQAGLMTFRSSTLGQFRPCSNGAFYCGLFRHFMRSFTVVDFEENEVHDGPGHPGLKCDREWITVDGFYRDSALKLVERRYSIALSLLPLQRTCGNYVLVSIADIGKYDIGRVWNIAPGFRNWDGKPDKRTWRTYGIQPAGLYTGVSMFQIQVCVFITSWRNDWITTIDAVDKMVSVSLADLRDAKKLRSLVLDADSGGSVSYFKVLRMLSIFSDSIREANQLLERLVRLVPFPEYWPKEIWFETSYPHMDETRRIISHNWTLVLKHQQEASDIILQRFERTTREVQGLMDGLFSVQSVTEAQKSRLLNKYILVFTIITIIFLPPTFVSTFFGVDLFESTKATFWTVFAVLSGVSYMCAAMGLFWSSLSGDERQDWAAWVANRPRAIKEPLRAFRGRASSLPRWRRREGKNDIPMQERGGSSTTQPSTR